MEAISAEKADYPNITKKKFSWLIRVYRFQTFELINVLSTEVDYYYGNDEMFV